METMSLRGSELAISRIAFGAEPLGGFEWGEVDIPEVERAVGAALDLGITLFDTADCYGKGESERRLGAALGARRNKAVISSKFGVRFDAQNRVRYDNSLDYIEQALDASLARLGTDWIDLYQLHWPDGHTPLEDVLDRLDRLRQAGKIRAYGVTNVAPDLLAPHAGRAGLASFSQQYSIAHRDDEAAIRHLGSQGLRFLSWGSLGQGILSGRYDSSHAWPDDDRRRRPEYKNFHGDRLARSLALVEKLRQVAARENYASPAIAALRFILDSLPSAAAIVGIKSVAQVTQNAQGGLRPMSAESLAELVAVST